MVIGPFVMDRRRAPNDILWIGAIGSLAIVALSWLDEWLQLPALLIHGRRQAPNWQECATETVVVTLVWVITYWVTRRLVRRLRYLEEFLRVCAWCKKVDLDGSWVSLEKYFDAELDTQTTHGICPACAAKQKEELAQLARRRASGRTSSG
jgi:hypothetical protein